MLIPARLKICALVLGAALLVTGCEDHKEDGHADGTKKPSTGEHKHSQNEGKDAHEDHAAVVRLKPDQVKLGEIKTAAAAIGEVAIALRLAGEIAAPLDRVAHVPARVPGFVREVRRTLGDAVRAGDVLAVSESREFAELKATYLAARERASLAQEKFAREERLWKQKITAEQEYLEARQTLAKETIELRSAEQALRSLGLTQEHVKAVARDGQVAIPRLEIVAPIDGAVIEQNIVVGQRLDADTKAFVVGDLGRVWVIASVYEKDIARVKSGQAATVAVRAIPGKKFQGRLTWIAQAIDEKTRTLKVRIEVDNADGLLKPGMFARVELAVDTKSNVVVVPPSSLLQSKGETFVFVEEPEGRFERREIATGLMSGTAVEIVAGLSEGEKVVTQGTLLLNSELEKERLGGGHAH